MSITLRIALLSLLVPGVTVSARMTTHAPPPVLRLPIACTPGKTCFIQQYADHDPGPGAKDYHCGSLVYDGHDGTDIRLPTVAAQKRGVAVLAAADGNVLAIRDGVADHLIEGEADRAAIKGRECGNGVLMRLANGWQAQYCHMANGSIAVEPGQAVHTGETLGRVGLSGNTEFPHLHFAIRDGARKVDPFAPDAAPGTCSPTPGHGLWDAQGAAALAYRATDILNAGFAQGLVTMQAIEDERLPEPHGASPAVVFYGRAIGLLAGDHMRVTVTGPGGQALAENDAAIDTPKAQYMLFAGKKRPPSGWPSGRYKGTVTVAREGRTVASRTDTITL